MAGVFRAGDGDGDASGRTGGAEAGQGTAGTVRPPGDDEETVRQPEAAADTAVTIRTRRNLRTCPTLAGKASAGYSPQG